MGIFKNLYRRILLKTNFDIGWRYLSVIDYLKKQNMANATILEIGSSSEGIAAFLPTQITGVDINFPRKVKSNLIPVKINGTKLPFKRNAFDYVVCVDTLEHIQKVQRYHAISEMIRVAKKAVLLVIPLGRYASLQDQKLQKIYLSVHHKPFGFLIDHIQFGLPDRNTIMHYIKDALKKYKTLGHCEFYSINNLFIRHLFMNLETRTNSFTMFLAALFSLLLPFWKLLNFGRCYRGFFVVKLGEQL